MEAHPHVLSATVLKKGDLYIQTKSPKQGRHVTFKRRHIICETDTLLNGLTHSKLRTWNPAQEMIFFFFFSFLSLASSLSSNLA